MNFFNVSTGKSKVSFRNESIVLKPRSRKPSDYESNFTMDLFVCKTYKSVLFLAYLASALYLIAYVSRLMPRLVFQETGAASNND